MSTTMTIRLDDDVKERLGVLVDATQRSKSFLAAEAIRAYVETNELQIAEIRGEGRWAARRTLPAGCRGHARAHPAHPSPESLPLRE